MLALHVGYENVHINISLLIKSLVVACGAMTVPNHHLNQCAAWQHSPEGIFTRNDKDISL